MGFYIIAMRLLYNPWTAGKVVYQDLAEKLLDYFVEDGGSVFGIKFGMITEHQVRTHLSTEKFLSECIVIRRETEEQWWQTKNLESDIHRESVSVCVIELANENVE